MEWLKQFIEFLNSCAGLLSLLAVLAAIIVPIKIYNKQRKNARQVKKLAIILNKLEN